MQPTWLTEWPSSGIENVPVLRAVRVHIEYLASRARPITFVDTVSTPLTAQSLADLESALETKYAFLHYLWKLVTRDMFPHIADKECEVRAPKSSLKRCVDAAEIDDARPYKVPAQHAAIPWRVQHGPARVAEPAVGHILGPYAEPSVWERKLGACFIADFKHETETTVWDSQFCAVDRNGAGAASFDRTAELIEVSWASLVDGLRTFPHLLVHIEAMIREYKRFLDIEWQRRRDILWNAAMAEPTLSGFFKHNPTLQPQQLAEELFAL